MLPMPLALLCQTLVLSPGGSGTPSGPEHPGARTLGSPGASPQQGTRATSLLAETPSTAFCIGSGGDSARTETVLQTFECF